MAGNEVSFKWILLTWSCKLDNGRQYTINNLHHHPLQFNLGELSTMSTIYDTKGEGWNKVPNIERYFRSDNPRDDNIAQLPITTSHQYKENLILLMTMFEIKKIILGKNMQKFRMRCSMRNYEQGNNAICKRHPTLFKDKKDITIHLDRVMNWCKHCHLNSWTT